MKIVIVGGGIIGLSTGLYLKQNGNPSYDVTIVTDKTTPETTADGAAGIWGIYLLTGTPVEDQKRWAQDTHDFVENLWKSEDGGSMGITLVNSIRLNHEPKNAEVWKEIVYGFKEMNENELGEYGRLTGSHKRGYDFMTYTIEPIKLLPHMLAEFKNLGGKMITGKKVINLAEVAEEFGADVLINCTGVWAGEITGDKEIAPLRGQVMRVQAPWIKRVVLDDLDDGNYIISNQDSVVFGGTHQANDWDTNPRPEDTNFIWNGCKAMMPYAVNGAKHLRDWVGLRPGRNSVRLGREKIYHNGKRRDVIHNYGHGGSGITIFWGCAKDAFNLVQKVEEEQNRDLIRARL